MIELGAPLVLFVSRLRVPWVVLAWCMHAAIAATMFVVFPYPLALIAFAPLFRLERFCVPEAHRAAVSRNLGVVSRPPLRITAPGQGAWALFGHPWRITAPRRKAG